MHYSLFYITEDFLQVVYNRCKLIYCTTLTLPRINHKIFIPLSSARNFAFKRKILQSRDLPNRKYIYKMIFTL